MRSCSAQSGSLTRYPRGANGSSCSPEIATAAAMRASSVSSRRNLTCSCSLAKLAGRSDRRTKRRDCGPISSRTTSVPRPGCTLVQQKKHGALKHIGRSDLTFGPEPELKRSRTLSSRHLSLYRCYSQVVAAHKPSQPYPVACSARGEIIALQHIFIVKSFNQDRCLRYRSFVGRRLDKC
jgi:hypothetical protein